MARGFEVFIPLTCSALLLMLLLFFTGKAQNSRDKQQTWCVAKPSNEDATLNGNINYACSQVDCRILQMDCAYPDKLISHASIAMNLYYQAMGRNYWNCYFNNSGLIVITDPSFDHCSYAWLLIKYTSAAVKKASVLAVCGVMKVYS
ncbi:glucan endo-1,3-beta-D-glucosidase-like [Phalaenopsis equestris]|uniref:glucan endo-1,3-beta-D-glucosidase-like n=1 Tax=Phalaenopsis equestris TaxID=78828 RepID=UPI0009E648AE|nr:glucan endo-1,3-beta-D-glucosidase-like [Phalaenopsis equestris]XP_020584716.1 glucan endo-1,3-beta-D-glucosidase-like [Phalaenopsis equestris]